MRSRTEDEPRLTARGSRYDVFVSYKSQDAQVAREITDQLIASGIRAWFAEYQVLLTDRDRFQRAIYDGIARSEFGLAITNDRYTSSEYCRDEMRRLLQHVGPGGVLEVRLPDEHEPHRMFPALGQSPQSVPGGTAEILSFLRDHTGWNIRPMVEIDRSEGRRRVDGICLGARYQLDVTGWDVIDPRGYRHPDGTVEGPVLRYPDGEYRIDVNVFAGPELAPQARRQDRTADDREMYDALIEYLSRYLGGISADIKGLHLLFHGDLSQMAVTYTMRGYWTRKYSVILPHPSEGEPAEFVFTFGFVGPFEEYCRHVRLMDGLVSTLEWH